MNQKQLIDLKTVFSLGISTLVGIVSAQSVMAMTSKDNSLLLDRKTRSPYSKITFSQSQAGVDITTKDRFLYPTKKSPWQIARQSYRGKASWYGGKFHGRRTASGEIFNSNALTAAHRTLPFGTRVRVTNVINGRSVIVRINDRGPFAKGRIIDVSAAAARRLNMINSGVASVQIEILGR